jgi:hypothetical protein
MSSGFDLLAAFPGGALAIWRMCRCFPIEYVERRWDEQEVPYIQELGERNGYETF